MRITHSMRRGVLGVALVTFALCACGADGRYVVIGTNHAPSASGTVEIDALDGQNTQVALHLEFLYAPARVADDARVYMVWFVPVSGAAVRGGVLKYNSEQRTGDLNATSPFSHFTLKITAERDARVSAPNKNLVASQEIKRE